jgi:flagellin
MPLRINDNPGSSFGLNQLNDSGKALEKSLARLSSGRKITRTADDASGSAIANNLRSQSLALGQSIRNANDAISVVQVADAALGEAASLIDTIRTKALQADNDSQSIDSRRALQADITQALEQLNQIAGTTSFNGQELLSGTFIDRQFQIGANAGQALSISIDSIEAGKLGNESAGPLSTINVLTREGAQAAVEAADAAMAQIDTVRSGLGSKQNQLASAINNLSTTRTNLESAESAIADVDFAEETMNLAQIKALTKTKTFVLTQANNVNQESVLTLLQG